MKRILAHLAAALSIAAAFPADAAGVAFITDLKGGVQLEGQPRVAVLAELAQGARLTLAADGAVTLLYTASGREFVLKGPGRYEVGGQEIGALDGAAPKARSTEWKASNRVLAQVSQTSAASVRMRSLAKPAAAVEPAAVFPEGPLATLQPVFRWSGDAKGGEFVLMADGQPQPVHAGKVTSATYRLPAKLKPETEYYWRVSAGSDQLASGRFRTLPAESIRTIEARRPGAKAEFSDRLLFALMLHEMGAQQEAREAWAALSKERADLPELSAPAK